MKKGFSFVVLSATVAIMLILLTTLVVAGTNSANTSKKLAFATELTTIQQAVNGYKDKNNGLYPISDNIELDITQLNSKYKTIFETNAETISSGRVLLNQIDYEKAGITSSKYGNLKNGENDIYAISQKTGIVYYAKGIKIGNNTYFMLDEELKNVLNYNTEKEVKVEDPVVIFSPSIVEWTRESITMEIKIPNEYELVSISENNVNTTNYIASNIGLYQVYTLTENENTMISVTYSKKYDKSITKTATYNITNIDNKIPDLIIDSNQVNLKMSNTSNLIGYMKILQRKDSGSGIKILKYENNSTYAGELNTTQKQNVKSHFETSGKAIDKNVVPIERGAKNITIYLEDNAGNWIIKTIDVKNTYEYNTNDYIKDGLILHLDGINNTRNGQSSYTKIWEDLSGNGNDATMYNFNSNADSGWFDKGINFDGVDDYLDIQDSSTMKPVAQTIEIIFNKKQDVLYKRMIYFVRWTGYTMEINVNNILSYGRDKNGYLLSSTNIISSKRYSISTTHDANISKMYLNSNFENQQTVVPSSYNDMNKTDIGGYKNNYHLKGEILSIRMYNRALTEKEIEQNYNIDKSRFGI